MNLRAVPSCSGGVGCPLTAWPLSNCLLFQLQVYPACQAGEGEINGNLSDSTLGSKALEEKMIKVLNKK